MRQSLSQTSEMSRGVRPALWAGLAVTAAVTAWALIDPSTTRLLAGQIEIGYPSYPSDQIDSAAGAYVAILVSVGVLGMAGWGATLLLVHTGRRWAAAWVGGVLCAAGILVALTGLVTPDTSGVTGLAPVFGWALLAPCVVGVLAVAAMFTRRAR
ncbi:hypothetical protein [Actinoalloteichus spitiensis]|uniref:hypothetical protein n=1 Tax=Actinoalloteichus spitiensis TaxID=252394 RepID=UPI0012F62964|nr:hypothetical protein [Actinoalloteichus spitiensis]